MRARTLPTSVGTRIPTGFIGQFLRYAVAGGVAFCVDYGLLFVLTRYGGMHYLGSAAAGFLAGLAVNYVISLLWVFGPSAGRSRSTEFLLFALIGVVGLGLNELLMYVLTGLSGLHYMLSKGVSTVVVYFWNFLARRRLMTSPA